MSGQWKDIGSNLDLLETPNLTFLADDELDIPMDVMQRVTHGEHPVKVYRQFKRIPLTQFAKQLGVSPHYVKLLENGDVRPSRALVLKISKLLGVHVTEIA